jgi:pimeloyl-ACP methyl ester carboxylesterase
MVNTATGGALYADVRLGTKLDKRPIVYLSGLPAFGTRSREIPFLEALNKAGYTVIKIVLPGQGETLARALKNDDSRGLGELSAERQAQTLLEAVRALGVEGPFDMAGVSYGARIGAFAKRLAPDLVGQLMMMAPFAERVRDPLEDMMRLNPYFHGAWVAGVKQKLADAFPNVPEVLRENAQAYFDGLYRLWLGAGEESLASVVRGMKDVHLIGVPGDKIASPEALDRAAGATVKPDVTHLGEEHRGDHFLPGQAPKVASDWVLGVLAAAGG